jgi:uncharacterized protein (TIGR02246 family)
VRKLVFAIALALAWAASLAPLAAARADSAEEQVTAAYAAWNEAFNEGDAAALAAFYDDEAVMLPPTHDVLEGPAGAEKFFGGLFANDVTGHGLELIEVEGDEDDDLVVAAARWSAKGKDANGADAAFGGVATHVFERQDDGSLKLRLHTFN